MSNHLENEKVVSIDIGFKRNLDYIADVLSKFNQGIKFIKICSLGGNASKAMHISQILCDNPDLNIEYHSMESSKISVFDVQSIHLGIIIKKNLSKDNFTENLKQFEQNELTFIDFPLYHLLLDMMLNIKKSLRIFMSKDKNETIPLIEITKNNFEISCKTLLDINDSAADKLSTAYNRCGLILSEDGIRTAKILSESDDVIIGVDTNILYDATVTAQLLDLMAVINTKNFVQLPNWIFFIIPSSVMTEIEHCCNLRAEGLLTARGRAGFRAMQEIQEIDTSEDYLGVSLSITGTANPILETGYELKKINRELTYFSNYYKKIKGFSEKSTPTDQKSSSGDMLIRDQFKEFLRQMDFHKNTYFLTADKSNASLARTEGLFSILFRAGNKSNLFDNSQKWSLRKWRVITPPTIECIKSQMNTTCSSTEKSNIKFSVPLGSLIYELAVEFGTIIIKWDGGNVFIRGDRKWEDLEYWLNKDLMIEYNRDYDGWDKLLKNYYENGKFPLNNIRRLWIEINHRDIREFKDNHIAPDFISNPEFRT